MNQKDNTLYAFLKKNAAYSTGGNSSQRNSDMDSNRRPNFNEVNRSFNAPQNYAPDRTSEGMRQGNNHIFSDNASVLTFGAGQRDNNDRGMGRQDEGRTLGRNNINININNNNNNNN